MTTAVCYKCGALKFGAFTPCGKCQSAPSTEDELALSMGMTDHYFDKETGILLKMVTEDTLAKTKHSFALSDVKLNVEFPDDHFTFTPPEGVEVQDLTIRGAVKAPIPAKPD